MMSQTPIKTVQAAAAVAEVPPKRRKRWFADERNQALTPMGWVGQIVRWVLLLIFAALFLYPLVWLISASLKPRGEVFDNEIIWQGRPGERRIALAVSARQLLDDDGESQGCIVVTRDITPEIAAVGGRG